MTKIVNGNIVFDEGKERIYIPDKDVESFWEWVDTANKGAHGRWQFWTAMAKQFPELATGTWLIKDPVFHPYFEKQENK
jgi:hypothetical protein